MKCIKNEIIIQYLDNQLSPSEKNSIEDHVSHCSRCESAVAEMKDNVALVKKDLSLLNPEAVDVPLLICPEKTDKQKSLSKIFRPAFAWPIDSSLWIKRIVIPTAAVLILVTLTIINFNIFERESDPVQIETVINDLDEIIIDNPNEWWTDRRLIIIIIDEDKKTVERIITSKNEDDIIREVTHLQ